MGAGAFFSHTPVSIYCILQRVHVARDAISQELKVLFILVRGQVLFADSAAEELRVRPGVLPDVFLDGAMAKLEGRWCS